MIFENPLYGVSGNEYDCSNKTVEEWYQSGTQNIPIGIYFMFSGVVYILLYVLCMIAIASKDLYKHSCYKLMLLLGIIDVSALIVNSVLTGYLTIIGAVYCTHPNLIYFAGSYGMAAWCAACAACVILALNRVCDMSDNIKWKLIFQRSRLYMIMSIPILYFLFFFLFTKPALFNSNYIAWFFDPFIGDNIDYVNIPHTVNNVAVSFCTSSLYGYLCFKLNYKNKAIADSCGPVRASTAQRMIFAQSLLICGFNAIAAWIYVVMQFASVGPVVALIGQIGWQTSHGFVCIIYLIMNRSIRNAVLNITLPRNCARRLGMSMSSCGRPTLTVLMAIKKY